MQSDSGHGLKSTPNKKYRFIGIFYLASPPGLEPGTAVLETDVLPLKL